MSAEFFLDGRVSLHHGNCIEVLKTIPDDSFDAIVTDPPYGLEFMGKGWDGADGFRRSLNQADTGRENVFGRTSQRAPEYRTAGAGVIGKPGIGDRSTEWVSNQGWNQFRCEACGKLIGNGGSPCRCDEPKPVRADNRWPLFQEFMHAVGGEMIRVLKPGGHLLAFGGTRTYHRMVCGLEDAGFEIRDQIGWAYGQGFPKSLNVALELEQKLCERREVDGVKQWVYLDDGSVMARVPPFRSPDANEWAGWGTALKPAWEPICVARKPLIGTVAANVRRWGTGALNIDGCRIENSEYDPSKVQRQSSNRQTWEGGAASGFSADHEQQTYNAKGRWPANVVHDGSDEVVVAFPVTSGGTPHARGGKNPNPMDWGNDRSDGHTITGRYEAPGSAARFFYCAKATKADRAGSKHPTVKPIRLIGYLCRLVCPPGGLILDPFGGSGTTGEAAFLEGFEAVLIEKDAQSCADIRNRLARLEKEAA